jgi:hypothetical protein
LLVLFQAFRIKIWLEAFEIGALKTGQIFEKYKHKSSKKNQEQKIETRLALSNFPGSQAQPGALFS